MAEKVWNLSVAVARASMAAVVAHRLLSYVAGISGDSGECLVESILSGRPGISYVSRNIPSDPFHRLSCLTRVSAIQVTAVL